MITVYIIKFSFGSKMVKNFADLGGCYPPQPTTFSEICRIPPPRGGGVIPYISHIRMYRPKGYGFWAFFCLKTGIHITHFGLESGMVFEGTTGAYEHIYRFNSKLIRKIEICEFEYAFDEMFACALI